MPCRSWIAAFAFAALGLAAPAVARADGCYVCGPGTFVKYKGSDTWASRHKAEACGCKIQGTVSSCDGVGAKILCSVSLRLRRSGR